MNKLAVFVLLVGVAACSNQKPEEGREPAQTGAPGAVVGSAVAPSPGAPAGTAPAAGAKPPETSGNVGCATAITLTCAAEQVDGCASGLTAVHVCVAKDAKPGPPCAQELALSCPAGQVDACLHSPPQATTHVCVVVAKPNP